MNTDDIVRNVVYDQIKSRRAISSPDDISLDATLEAVGLASLHVVGVVIELEEVFDIGIPDHISGEWVTVGDIASYIRGAVRA